MTEPVLMHPAAHAPPLIVVVVAGHTPTSSRPWMMGAWHMAVIAANLVTETLLLAVGLPPPVYVVCLIVGGGMLLISSLLGGDHDLSADGGGHFDVGSADATGGADVAGGGHAGHHPGAALVKWFSLQFVVFFLASFGLIGTVLTYTTEATPMATSIWSLASGVVLGQAAHQTLAWLKRSGGNTETTVADFLNRGGRVSLAIEPLKRGEVSVVVRGQERFVPAIAKRPDDRFALGSSVVVVAFDHGVAEVISTQEYEFLNEPGSAGASKHVIDRAGE